MTRPKRPSAAWVLLIVSGVSLAFAWALASPVGASPDEPMHIAYSWGTVTGQTIVGEQLVTTPRGGPSTSIRIPEKLLRYIDPSCYSFNSAQKPVSQCSPIPADTMQIVTKTSVMTGYPPPFYAFEGAVLRAGTAVGLSGPRVLYGTRIAAALLSGLAIGFGVVLLRRRFPSQVVILATLLALPATAWFLAASVNPNGFEVAATYLLAAGVLSLRVDHLAGVRTRAAVLAVPLGTFLLAWSRPLSWVWASLILTLLFVPIGQSKGARWKQRLPIRRLGALAGVTTAAVLVSSMGWFGYAYQLRAAKLEASGNYAAWVGLKPIGRVGLLLLQTGRIATEQIGTFGWIDTPLPTVVILVWVAVAGMAGLIWFVGRNTMVPQWTVGAVLVLGYLAAMLDEYAQAFLWQGRYLLPVTAAICVLGVPGLTSGLERLAALQRAVPWMIIVLMAVNALSVVWYLFRNLYGIRSWLLNQYLYAPLPGVAPLWSPPLGQGVVLGLVGLALACGVIGVWKLRPTPECLPQSSMS